MAVDKLVDSSQLDSDLTSVANAIRSKTGGSASLAFPSGYVAAINSIPIYTVRTITKSLTKVTASNSASDIINGSSYYCELTPDSGYLISSITVTMGGVDITSQVFSGGIGEKGIVANGTYNASDDNLSGYSKVVVNVPTGSGATLGTKTVTSNGTYNASSDSLDGYSSVTVNVSNSYSSSDEGKVVSNGTLVSQGSDTVTTNGTVNTTLISSLTVNVPISSGFSLLGSGTYTKTSSSATISIPISYSGTPKEVYYYNTTPVNSTAQTIMGYNRILNSNSDLTSYLPSGNKIYAHRLRNSSDAYSWSSSPQEITLSSTTLTCARPGTSGTHQAGTWKWFIYGDA